MTLSDLIMVALTPIIGCLGVALLFALKEYLRKTFLTKAHYVNDQKQAIELRKVEEARVARIEELATNAASLAASARQKADDVDVFQRRMWEDMTERIIAPLNTITDKLGVVSETQSAMAATMVQLEKRLEDARTPHSGSDR